jgi:uncharacterized protein (TIGR02466 family)
MKVYNIFPLTICQSKIDIEDKEISNLISLIKEMKASSKNIDYYNKIGSWTGDTQGFENLHHNSEFNNLFGEIKKKLIEYLDVLNIDQEQLDIYIQRSWATISEGKEHIDRHSHLQSHISFAYYLKKSKEDSKIIFYDDKRHNELIPGLFESPTANKRKIMKKFNVQNSASISIDPEEDDIIIFPSKTPHSTQPNAVNNQRISISADISLIAKDSKLLEHLTPPIKNWIKI